MKQSPFYTLIFLFEVRIGVTVLNLFECVGVRARMCVCV